MRFVVVVNHQGKVSMLFSENDLLVNYGALRIFILCRYMDLRSQFDPHQLAEEAVNLNLRLMLWRAAPNLDTQKIADSKCLLLGEL